MAEQELTQRMEAICARMEALLTRLEGVVDSLSRGPGEGLSSGASVYTPYTPEQLEADQKEIKAFIEQWRSAAREDVPVAD